MPKKRKRYTPEEKVSILRRHLLDGVPVSDLCDAHGIHPTMFYQWQKVFFEQGASAFAPKQSMHEKQQAKKIAVLEAKLTTKNEVLSELMEEHIFLSALDVFSGQVFGIVEDKTGILPFQKLVDHVMGQEPYKSAHRAFWIVDNGSSHYTTTFPKRLAKAYDNAIAVHLPIHASWLNQIEIYFSILQRKALTPNDLGDRQAMQDRILGFQEQYNLTAKPFNWHFTRQDMKERIARLDLAA